jgi:acetate kinase
MRVIVVNSGSSSVKYEAFELEDFSLASKGLMEHVGPAERKLKHQWLSPSGNGNRSWRPARSRAAPGLRLHPGSGRPGPRRQGDPGDLRRRPPRRARGEKFREPAIIDDATLGEIEG